MGSIVYREVGLKVSVILAIRDTFRVTCGYVDGVGQRWIELICQVKIIKLPSIWV